jgi:hypothetical protein
MTDCKSFAAPSSLLRSWLLAGAVMATFATLAPTQSFGQAATQTWQPPRGPASQFRARLASWQNADGGQMPAEQPPMPMGPAEPLPQAAPQVPQSRLKNPPPAGSYAPSSSVPHAPAPMGPDFASQSLDQWMQDDGGCATCGPGGCGPSCGPACGPGGCMNCPEDPCFRCRPNLWWFDFNILLGFRKGRSYPALVTTDPSTEDSTTAGVLPGATILYGADVEDENTQMQPGASFDFGTWLNDSQTVGFGGRYFFLGDDNGDFSTNSGEHSVLAIPFFSVDLGAPSALLLAHPDIGGEVRSGSVAIRASNQVYGFDAYARFLYCHTPTGRIDFITGWHTSSVNDNFSLLMQTDGNQANNEIRLLDEFNTENTFHGVTMGIMTEHQCCCWVVKTRSRVSVGNMHQQVNINGGTTVNGVPNLNEPGGLFTASSNIGNYSQDQFAAVTEAGVSVGYFINPNVQLAVGYNLMYWSNVVRPGGQIDTTIDDLNVPPTSPTFQFNTSSFWVQSVTLNLNWQF